MLTNEQLATVRRLLMESKNPLFFHDDDPDGLSSFLLLYKKYQKGHGSVVKTVSYIDQNSLHRVMEYHPDLIVILDVPVVEQDFLDNVNVPVIWIDHHQPLERNNVIYVNPRIQDIDAYIPTTRMAYQITEKKEDMWVAMAGCLGDYYLPDFTEEFAKKHPHLLQENQTIDQAKFGNLVGKLPQIMSFLLKGRISDVKKHIKILTRVKDADELFNSKTSQARYVMKRYKLLVQPYNNLLERARKTKPEGNLVLFMYASDEHSFTSELSNELAFYFPDNVVIVAREKDGEMRCSIRGNKKNILDPLTEALKGLDGNGGGHQVACGAGVNVNDWPEFLKRFKELIVDA
ncbi:MAG: hypothetical protein CMH61_02585 [Nanoarchaeota archaeon]|nr:hypothetical protein [Nanoarchaeota archaeon]